MYLDGINDNFACFRETFRFRPGGKKEKKTSPFIVGYRLICWLLASTCIVYNKIKIHIILEFRELDVLQDERSAVSTGTSFNSGRLTEDNNSFRGNEGLALVRILRILKNRDLARALQIKRTCCMEMKYKKELRSLKREDKPAALS